ncbi:MAG: AmmeMemoRadiSam system protein B [Candidatus Cloacimonetes bacterium 4572_55]|nr:MAG: AmmeMemoRadiSam system protein B [Candidatus Cloacimonetes bacterium 4572_55]
MEKTVRQPAVAGMFYTENSEQLQSQINRFYKNARPESVRGGIVGLISPHAGYYYSGQVSAYGYKLLKPDAFDSVIVIAPSHNVPFDGCSLYHIGGYRTPLGTIDLDEEIIERMMQADDIIGFNKDAHKKEHSLEVQLPLLQGRLKKFKLTPILMGRQVEETWTRLAEVITSVVSSMKNKKILLIGSTDLSHFYNYQTAVDLDKAILDRVNAYDIDGLRNDVRNRKCEACGAGPMLAVMTAAKQLGADSAKVLNYINSGYVNGDHSRVVGYMSAVLFKRERPV